jgi:hypothetical protein
VGVELGFTQTVKVETIAHDGPVFSLTPLPRAVSNRSCAGTAARVSPHRNAAIYLTTLSLRL